MVGRSLALCLKLWRRQPGSKEQDYSAGATTRRLSRVFWTKPNTRTRAVIKVRIAPSWAAGILFSQRRAEMTAHTTELPELKKMIFEAHCRGLIATDGNSECRDRCRVSAGAGGSRPSYLRDTQHHRSQSRRAALTAPPWRFLCDRDERSGNTKPWLSVDASMAPNPFIFVIAAASMTRSVSMLQSFRWPLANKPRPASSASFDGWFGRSPYFERRDDQQRQRQQTEGRRRLNRNQRRPLFLLCRRAAVGTRCGFCRWKITRRADRVRRAVGKNDTRCDGQSLPIVTAKNNRR